MLLSAGVGGGGLRPLGSTVDRPVSTVPRDEAEPLPFLNPTLDQNMKTGTDKGVENKAGGQVRHLSG